MIAGPNKVDLRKTHRYPLSLLARFTWAYENGLTHSGEGVTRDIDANCVYVFASQLPPPRSRIQVEIRLPGIDKASHGAYLLGEGNVLRVDDFGPGGNGEKKGGFAASIHFSTQAVLEELSNNDVYLRVVT